jgi:hypothetical protein
MQRSNGVRFPATCFHMGNRWSHKSYRFRFRINVRREPNSDLGFTGRRPRNVVSHKQLMVSLDMRLSRCMWKWVFGLLCPTLFEAFNTRIILRPAASPGTFVVRRTKIYSDHVANSVMGGHERLRNLARVGLTGSNDLYGARHKRKTQPTTLQS